MNIITSSVTDHVLAVDGVNRSVADSLSPALSAADAALTRLFMSAVGATVANLAAAGIYPRLGVTDDGATLTLAGDAATVTAFESMHAVIEEAVALELLARCREDAQPATAAARRTEARALAAHVATLVTAATPITVPRRALSAY